MPLGRHTATNKVNPYDCYAGFARPQTDGIDSVDAGTLPSQAVAVRRPTLVEENQALALRRRKKVIAQDTADRIVGAMMSSEGSSLNWSIPKTDLKGEAGREDLKNKRINLAVKVLGVLHRYPCLNTAYTARGLLLFGTRVNQAVMGASTLSQTFGSPAYAALMGAATPFTAVYGAAQVVGTAYGSYKLGYSLYADVKSNNDRKEYKAIADGFDMYHGDTEKAHAMNDLLNKDRHLRSNNGGQVHKSIGQVACDRVADASECLVVKPVIGAAVMLGLSTSQYVLTTIVPGVSVAALTTMAGVYGWRTGVQIAAMNNAFWAADKTQNVVCKNTSRNIINERVVKARVNGGRMIGCTINTAMNVTSLAVGATGVGVVAIPVLSALGSAFMGATHMGMTMCDWLYTRKTEKLRAMSIKTFESDWKNLPQSGSYTTEAAFLEARNKFFSDHSYGRKNIGWTEKAMVRMLRGRNLTLRTQAVNYLLELGFSTQTIKRIQVEGKEVVALKALEVNLYANRLRHNWRANKYLHKSAGEALFISAGIRNIKKLHQMRKEYCARRASQVSPLPAAA